MLNSSFSKKLMLMTLLTSVATLTACGNKDAKTVSSGSSSSVVAKVTVKSSSVAATVASQTSSTETQVEAEGSESSSEEASSEETSPETGSQEETSNLASSFDLNALAAGDYSSIAGTWANAEGQVFTVTADGVLYFGEAFDENAHHKIEEAGLNSHGRVGGSLGYYHNGERAGGAHISIVPAGVANILDEVGDVDHIEIGHDVSSGYPEQQFFRQD